MIAYFRPTPWRRARKSVGGGRRRAARSEQSQQREAANNAEDRAAANAARCGRSNNDFRLTADNSRATSESCASGGCGQGEGKCKLFHFRTPITCVPDLANPSFRHLQHEGATRIAERLEIAAILQQPVGAMAQYGKKRSESPSKVHGLDGLNPPRNMRCRRTEYRTAAPVADW
ncbi:MAG: hypothetical protein MUD11_01495 [Rhodobacteraceae bacterium]|nr:hypothetical protein [Paracoccaceae bacterium]